MPVVSQLESPPVRQSRALACSPRASLGYAPYLEGLRGLAALYVVLHHAALQTYGETYDSESLSTFATWWLAFFDRGELAVALFIVLSGYCLMLPVAATGHIRDGAWGFFRRRAQRILPAYYATLALVLGVLWIAPDLNEPSGARWDLALPALEHGAVMSHLLLVHNFDADWIWKIDGPLWSVAVEWQLYWLFPLLCAVFVRAGARAGSAFGLLLALAATAAVVSWDATLAARTCPWYIGLFALGMGFAARLHAQSERRAARWRWMAWVAGALVAAWAIDAQRSQLIAFTGWELTPKLSIDALVALALGGVLAHFHDRARAGRRSRLQALLETPWLLRLGSLSYCLYLVHDPLLSFMERTLLEAQLAPEARVWAHVLISVPLASVCAYALSAVAERPFLPRRPLPSRRLRSPSGRFALRLEAELPEP